MGALNGKIAIITGAGSGIGRASALRFAAEGAKLVIGDKTAAVHETAQAVKDAGGEVVALEIDAGVEADVQKIVATAKEHFGRVDVLAHMAGILRAVRTEEMTLELWNQVIGVNLTGTFLLTRAAIGELVATRGSVVLAALLHLLASPPASNMISRAAYLTSGLPAGAIDEHPALRLGPVDQE